MRKLIAVEWLSLDGVMEAPEEWAFSYSDDQMAESNAEGMAASDALLLGRVTYEMFAAFWPHQPAGTPIADHINSVSKYVVSQTLEEPLEWHNSSLIRGDEFAQRIAEMKRQPGKNITTVGSGMLVRSLIQAGLLDELRLAIPPVVLGSGKRLFEDSVSKGSLKLAKAREFDSGVVELTYELEAG